MRKNSKEQISYIVASKVKERIAKAGLRSSSELADAFSEMIERKIMRAIERAKSNGRQTIRAEDL